jgi:hypothetical protein
MTPTTSADRRRVLRSHLEPQPDLGRYLKVEGYEFCTSYFS